MSQVSQLAAASRHWQGDTAGPAMIGVTRAFVAAATQDESLLREAAAALSTLDAGAAAWIAVNLGAMVERGASAEISGAAVLAHLRDCLPHLPASPENDDEPPPKPTLEQAIRLAQFQYVCQAAVTHLARLPELRAELGRDAALLERLQALGGYSHGAWWVHEALLKTSGTLVLLHPPSGSGLRLWYRNVAHNFHLFSLLQTAVGTAIPGGRTPDEVLTRVARGKSAEAANDEAWWHYGSASSTKPDANATLWGEALVRDIPAVNGEPVILLWPPVLASRSWDTGFLQPHLEAMPADAGVERLLTAEEAQAWLSRLGVKPKRRGWWPF